MGRISRLNSISSCGVLWKKGPLNVQADTAAIASTERAAVFKRGIRFVNARAMEGGLFCLGIRKTNSSTDYEAILPSPPSIVLKGFMTGPDPELIDNFPV